MTRTKILIASAIVVFWPVAIAATFGVEGLLFLGFMVALVATAAGLDYVFC